MDSVVAMHPYYIARAIGGLLFFVGTVVGFYNIWMTIRRPINVARELATDRPVTEHAGAPAAEPAE